MSVVVWDGRTLAADKQSTTDGLKRKTTKIYKINGDLVGFTGAWDLAQTIKQWYANGAKPDEWPDFQANDDKWVGILAITSSGKVHKYERSPYPMDYTKAGAMCIGSGRDYAYGALAMGADARQAVLIAIKYDAGCGMGVDTLTFERVK